MHDSTANSALLSEYIPEREMPISARGLRNYRQRGEGPPWIKVFGKVYYSKIGFSKWLASLEVKSSRPLVRRRR